MIAVCRKIVGHFRHSVHASEALKSRQQQMQIPAKKLKQDVATRWNSTLMMLESRSRWPVSAVLSVSDVTNPKYRYLDLKPQQWELAEELIPPLQIVTTFLSYEFNVSCSCVLPVLFGLIHSLHVSDEDSSTISLFKCTVVSEIKRRWSLASLNPYSPLVIASALDPRFKQLKYASDDQFRDPVKQEILLRMEKVVLPNLPEATDEPGTDDDRPTKEPRKDTALDILLGPEKDPNEESTTFTDELQGYLTSKTVSRETDPLTWWRVNQYNYPHLAQVAKCFFSIPATSTPAERSFSKVGFIVNHLRSSLKPGKVNALLFLSKNLQQLS